MKIQIEEEIYEGTGTEIMEHLRLHAFDFGGCPDTDSYITQLQNNLQRMTSRECRLPKTGTEARAQSMLEQLAEIGALVFLSKEDHGK